MATKVSITEVCDQDRYGGHDLGLVGQIGKFEIVDGPLGDGCYAGRFQSAVLGSDPVFFSHVKVEFLEDHVVQPRLF